MTRKACYGTVFIVEIVVLTLVYLHSNLAVKCIRVEDLHSIYKNTHTHMQSPKYTHVLNKKYIWT